MVFAIEKCPTFHLKLGRVITILSEQDILKIIQNALELEEGALSLESSMENLDVWDSMGHLGILAQLDQAFDGKVADIQELAAADSAEKIIQILKDHDLVA